MEFIITFKEGIIVLGATMPRPNQQITLIPNMIQYIIPPLAMVWVL
jgi:hypothetical protein